MSVVSEPCTWCTDTRSSALPHPPTSSRLFSTGHSPELYFAVARIHDQQNENTCNRCPEPLRPQLYANVLLTGGNCALPNLRERLYGDLRAAAPQYCEVNVTLPEDPAIHAWRGQELHLRGVMLLCAGV